VVIVEVETRQTPRAEYERRRKDRVARAAQLARSERLLGAGRVVVFLLGAAMTYPALGLFLFSGW
jgi:peroxiredoxin